MILEAASSFTVGFVQVTVAPPVAAPLRPQTESWAISAISVLLTKTGSVVSSTVTLKVVVPVFGSEALPFAGSIASSTPEAVTSVTPIGNT